MYDCFCWLYFLPNMLIVISTLLSNGYSFFGNLCTNVLPLEIWSFLYYYSIQTLLTIVFASSRITYLLSWITIFVKNCITQPEHTHHKGFLDNKWNDDIFWQQTIKVSSKMPLRSISVDKTFIPAISSPIGGQYGSESNVLYLSFDPQALLFQIIIIDYTVLHFSTLSRR